jgi:polyisoprenoid-binding protein YceI
MAFAALFSFPLAAIAGDSHKVSLNPTESSISWTGKKLTGSHSGSVALKAGEVLLDGETIQSGKFEIDISKVLVKDIEDPKYNAKLVGHLKSDDFFSVEKFPVAEFVIASTAPLALPLASGENVTIKGSLKIKGLSQDVEFPAKVVVKDGMAEANGKVTLDRTKWGIRYGSGKFFQGLGDKLIFDEFEVDFAVKGKVVG